MQARPWPGSGQGWHSLVNSLYRAKQGHRISGGCRRYTGCKGHSSLPGASVLDIMWDVRFVSYWADVLWYVLGYLGSVVFSGLVVPRDVGSCLWGLSHPAAAAVGPNFLMYCVTVSPYCTIPCHTTPRHVTMSHVTVAPMPAKPGSQASIGLSI